MSNNNLLEVEAFTDGHNSSDKPKPKPRRKMTEDQQPKPQKRRTRGERESEELLSLSPSSSPIHQRQDSGYDNLVFQEDDKYVSQKQSKIKQIEDWSSEEEMIHRDKGRTHSPNRNEEDFSASEKESIVVKPDKQREQDTAETPAATENENEKAKPKGNDKGESERGKEKEAPTPETTGSRRSRIGGIWQKLMSRGSSKEQSRTESESKERFPSPGKSPTIKKFPKHALSSAMARKKTGGIQSDWSITSSETDNPNVVNPEVTPSPIKSTPVEKSRESTMLPARTRVQEKLQSLREKGKAIRDKKLKTEEAVTEIMSRRKPKMIHSTTGDSSSTEDESFDQETQKEIQGNRRPLQELRKKALSAQAKAKLKKLQVMESNSEAEKMEGDTTKPNSVLGITIHASDLLPMDPNVLHPVVKVTFLTQDGRPIRRSEEGWWVSQIETATSGKSQKKRKRRSTSDNIILPIMTQPFKFQLNSLHPVLSPTWNELLLFEEPFHDFLKRYHNLIIFFEIMDFLPMENIDVQNDGLHGSDLGWYKLAWAYLKPIGNKNTGKMVRLQLYKPVKLRRNEMLDGPEVYSWWKCGRREKLPNTTLYVAIKGVVPPLLPTSSSSNLRQFLSMRKEELVDAVIEHQFKKEEKSRNKRGGKKKSYTPASTKHVANWSRLEGQSCKVPNKLLAALPSSPIESLNLMISGNVHCVKFSPCGFKLAAGLDTEDLHAVLIFEIPSGHLLRSLKIHHGLIYELCWYQEDLEKGHYDQGLVSACADGTACVWIMKDGNELNLTLRKILHHPSFVYSARFHPTTPSIVVTACFDFIIRFWDVGVSKKVESKLNQGPKFSVPDHSTSPLFILDRHCSFVNCLTFDPVGNYLFSGDGDSLVLKWNIQSSYKKKTCVVEGEAKLYETGGIPVNSLDVHPNGMRLLVHLRDNCLKILDAATLVALKTIRGLTNDRLQIRSCFSPCGNLILSGNEEPSCCIWDADTYAVADFIQPKNHPRCFVTSVDYHPHDFFVAVGLASAISEPNPVLLYTYESSKFSKIAMIQAGVAKFKSSIRKNDLGHGQRKGVKFSAKRGDSSDKFMSIIDKLDSALKGAQEMKRVRQRSEGVRRTENRKDSSTKKENIGTAVSKSTSMQLANAIAESTTQTLSSAHPPLPPRRRKLTSTSTTTILRDPTGKQEPERDNYDDHATRGSVQHDLLSPKHTRHDSRQVRPHSSKIPVRTTGPKRIERPTSVPSSPRKARDLD